MALPTYIGKGTFQSVTTANTVSTPAPANIQSGDLLVAVVETLNDSTIQDTDGFWTYFNSSGLGTAGAQGSTRADVFYAFYSGSGSLGGFSTSASSLKNVQAYAFRNATGLGTSATGVKNDLFSTDVTITGITTTTADNLIFYAIGLSRDANSTTNLSGLSNATLQNETELHDQTVATGNGGGFSNWLAELPTAGSTGTVNPTLAAASTRAAWVVFNILPINAYTITADGGTYSYTGTAANTLYQRRMAADAGTYSFTGTAAALNRGYSITAATGSFGITGAAATLLKSSVMPAASASFAFTGTAANLNFGRVMVGDSGTYALTGTAANLTYTPTVRSYTMPADAGSFALTGASAGVFVGRVLSADGGSFAATGQVAGLLYKRNLVAASGSFAITGTDATLTKGVVIVDYVLPVDSGAFANSAPAAAFRRTYVIQAESALFAWQGAEVLLERYIPRYSRGKDSTGQASFRASPQATIRAAAAGMTRNQNSGFRRNGPKANHRPG